MTAACPQGKVEQVYIKSTNYFAWHNNMLKTEICCMHCSLDIWLVLIFQVLIMPSKYAKIWNSGPLMTPLRKKIANFSIVQQ
jgi:hypothetical protein